MTRFTSNTIQDGSPEVAALPAAFPRRHHTEAPAIIDAQKTVERRERIYRLSLLTADLVAVALALTLVFRVIEGGTARASVFFILPLIAVTAKAVGLYDQDELLLRRSTLDEIPRLFQLSSIAALLFWFGEGIFAHGYLGRAQVGTFALTLFAGIAGLRWGARRTAARVAPPERCLVIGDATDLDRLKTATENNGAIVWLGSVPILRVMHDLEELSRIASQKRAERLVIAPPMAAHEASVNLIRGAKAIGLRVSILPGIFEVVSSAVEFDHQPGVTLMGVKRFGLTHSSERLKRMFDIAGAVFALIAFAPILIVAAIAIKLDSKGPVIYRQKRVGRHGEIFEIFKFRSMVPGAHAMRKELAHLNEVEGGMFKIADDPRVTRVGRLLRKTSLDELPQLFNVLRGEMSMVGPRPLVADEDARVKGFDRRRLDLTPGMTGPWQVAGTSRLPLPEMVKVDYMYVAGWSLWADMKILVRTVSYVVSQRGH